LNSKKPSESGSDESPKVRCTLPIKFNLKFANVVRIFESFNAAALRKIFLVLFDSYVGHLPLLVFSGCDTTSIFVRISVATDAAIEPNESRAGTRKDPKRQGECPVSNIIDLDHCNSALTFADSTCVKANLRVSQELIPDTKG
jgi:hypothetical protein